MRLIEHDAKTLLHNAGLAVPNGILLPPDEPAPERAAMLKAQTLGGSRGKSGLIRRVAAEEAAPVLAALRDAMGRDGHASWVRAEAPMAFGAEYYLALVIDDLRQAPSLLLSASGGVDVEADPASVHRLVINPLVGLLPQHLPAFARAAGIKARHVGALCRFAASLYRVFVAADAVLLEINPLAATEAGLVALDAKCVLDDAAAFRHRERDALVSHRLERAALGRFERRAAEEGFTFVELEGSVALATGGAGLGMATLDMLADAGLPPANFIDAPGGGSRELAQRRLSLVFDYARRPEVKVIAFYTVLAASSLKNAVEGLLAVLDEMPAPKPLVCGFVATGAAEAEMTVAEARAALAERGVRTVSELSELVVAVREAVA